MPLLSKADFLSPAATTLPEEIVFVSALNASARIVGLTAAEGDEFETSLWMDQGPDRVRNRENVRAKLVARCARDADGARLFTNEEAALLGAVRPDIIKPLFDAALRVNGMSQKDADELGKPLPVAPTVDSPSSSPSSLANPTLTI